MVGKSENFFGNRNDPNRDERENITRIYTRPRVSVAMYVYFVVCVGSQHNYNILRCLGVLFFKTTVSLLFCLDIKEAYKTIMIIIFITIPAHII